MRFHSLSLFLFLIPALALPSATTTSRPATTTKPMLCNRDNCLRQLIATPTKAADFCGTYTVTVNKASTGLPTHVSMCQSLTSRVSSACSCLASLNSLPTVTPLPTTTPTSSKNSSWQKGEEKSNVLQSTVLPLHHPMPIAWWILPTPSSASVSWTQRLVFQSSVTTASPKGRRWYWKRSQNLSS